MTLPASEIALLYKNRWKIELFFKWIKQHLKIKSFWGISENAVRTQIYIAIITYTLVALIKTKLKLKQTPYEILQIISVSLLDKTHLPSLFENPINQEIKEQNSIQLKINLI
jgi:IS4 transposase